MRAYRTVATVGPQGDLFIPRVPFEPGTAAPVPFEPGSVVEVIVLEQEASAVSRTERPKKKLTPEQEAALERTLSRSYFLGGRFPSRDELHER